MSVILPAATGPRNEDSSDAWSMAHSQVPSGREDRPVRQQFPVHPADIVMADNDSSGRESEYRVRFV
jgi:hypothetical protein